jgi:hypothetical protein
VPTVTCLDLLSSLAGRSVKVHAGDVPAKSPRRLSTVTHLDNTIRSTRRRGALTPSEQRRSVPSNHEHVCGLHTGDTASRTVSRYRQRHPALEPLPDSVVLCPRPYLGNDLLASPGWVIGDVFVDVPTTRALFIARTRDAPPERGRCDGEAVSPVPDSVAVPLGGVGAALQHGRSKDRADSAADESEMNGSASSILVTKDSRPRPRAR